jgi:hypothetical protein
MGASSPGIDTPTVNLGAAQPVRPQNINRFLNYPKIIAPFRGSSQPKKF